MTSNSSTSDNPLDNLINSQSNRTLAPAAVGSQVALMSIVSVVTVIMFNILRPKNKMIYAPKVKYHVGDKPPPRTSDSLLGWLPPLIRTKEPELVDKLGLDAVTFLRFNRLIRWLFAGVTLLTCGILLPVNAVYNLKKVESSKRDILSMLTIRDVRGNVLFVHVAVTYIITFLIIGLVYVHWKKMVELRRQWYRSPEYMQSFYARTLQVIQVPRKYQSDEGIKAIFETYKVPYPTTSVHIGRKVGKLPELIEYHNTTVRELERYLVKYLKDGTPAKKRPTIRIGGMWGCGGERRDAIDFYTEKLKRTEAAIEEYRNQIDTRKPENYGFASMAAVPYAHIVARQLQGKHPKGTDISLAPNPKDILWENMNKSPAEIRTKRIIGFLWLCLVCFFNTVPLFIISILANLNQIKSYVQFLRSWASASPSSFAVISGVLPPAVSGIFGFFLPIIMRWLSQFMGALTHSKLDRQVIGHYFAFLVISQLVFFTLIGVIFNAVEGIVEEIGSKSFKDIINNLNTLPGFINQTYINQSSYWLTFFPLRGFLVVFDLAQILNVVWTSIRTRLFGRTPRDIREWTQPPEFQYAVYYSNLLFMAAVGLVFAPLAPLVALAACVVFWMGSWVYKYQLMFVYITKVETGGRLWNIVINRLMFIVVFMQALMVLTIGLQYGFKTLYWISTIPPIFIVAIFKIYLSRTFGNPFRYYTPLEEELRAAKVHSERADLKGNRLERRFGHPSLHAELFTPMLHAKMMPLLGQVYNGKIGKDQAKLDEYGGQKMEAQVVEGGIKIAAIEQRDLEYDPAMYRRDRGELDWDARSMASTALMSDAVSIAPSPSQPYVNSLPGYNKYMTSGPGAYELTRMDSQQEPLLGATYDQPNASQASLPMLPTMYHDASTNGLSREAPLHRPQDYFGDYPQQSHSPSTDSRSNTPFMEGRNGTPVSQYPPHPNRQYSTTSHFQYPTQHSQYSSQHQLSSPSQENVAGRGTYRG
jgi:calcium permeable stress-gated cation channel